MNIIIPMAGMGKRMRPHTLTTPKPLIPIAGKPMVQRIVEDVTATSSEKVEQIAFIISPKFGSEAEQHLLSVAASLGAKGRIFYQEEPLGTAHALLCAAECLNGPVFLAFADTLFKASFHIDPSHDAIVWTQKVEDPSAFGVVKLGANNAIEAFVEKPVDFVSDQAIIGVYYFKDGERLRQELQRLLDNDIKIKGEYQLTDAMDHMLQNGVKFYTDQVEEWLDCGNYSATVYTNNRILGHKHGTENLRAQDLKLENAIIIEPCFIGKGVSILNSVVGPHVSLEAGVQVEDSRISNSIIMDGTVVKNAMLINSLIGKSVNYQPKPCELSLGDFSQVS